MLLNECEKHFKTKDLYEVFRISNTATASEVKKAYYKLSMKWHPDKVDESASSKEEATAMFQLISKAYEVLSDKEKRKIYDETGVVDDEGVLENEEALNMWRKVFKKVTLEDIEKFINEYKDTEEEKQDIIAEYNRWDGDMGKIMCHVMGTNNEDEPRIKGIINDLIVDGTLKETKKFKSSTSEKKTATRKRKGQKEAKEAEEELKRIKKQEGDDSLQALILKRQQGRQASMDSFFDNLASKYGKENKKGSKKGKSK